MIHISQVATNKINEILLGSEHQNPFLRVGVEEGGCSGLSYTLVVDEEQKDGDLVLNQENFKIVVHKDSLLFIDGLTIDYEERGMLGGFTMDNPNAKVSCGCGASFRISNYRGKVQKCD
ncbi:HesB/IscA family protein [Paenibacillus faecalis]|uniref:HesB/IscA family protein n=1 Tax=Paenibacillus faecalis TaxID=2079532 RepID=UPI000D0F0F06|nr:iron-sulfur cluster assembly accessory protein [Paenibacillus faecalis]